MTTEMMPRFRSIAEAVSCIKAEDPESAVTEGTVRKLVRKGAIPSKRIGTKYFVSIEAIVKFYAGDNIEPLPEPTPEGDFKAVSPEILPKIFR